jgi:hypothetical protein
MGRSEHELVYRSGCGCCRVTRRGFLAGCAGCAAVAGTLFDPRPRWATASEPRRPRVRVVFCQPRNDRPTWPNVGYDYGAREHQIVRALTSGIPDVQFLPARTVDQSIAESGLLDADHLVDGYIICLLGLGWEYAFDDPSATGKPTLVVDNLFGGSGMFLTRIGGVLAKCPHVDWVSSSNDQDLVESARGFRLLQEGRTPREVVDAFRATRRARTPKWSAEDCAPDQIADVDFAQAIEQLRQMRILVVGGGWGGDAFRRAAQDVVGVTFIPIDFPELAAAYQAADPEAAREFSARWTKSAESTVEPSPSDIQASGMMYVGMQNVMRKYEAAGISINCLGGFYGGHLEAYPCLGFSEFNNQGLIGGCEADQMSALTMATIGALVGRPGFISDPVIDTSKNQIIYAHCVAMTKPFGPDGPANPYRIRSHSEDRKGAAIQSLLPPGYLTTTLEIDPVSRQVLFHQAKAAGNNPSDMACRTKLEATVQGDIEKLTENWRMGWHRVTFYGDLRDPVTELCDRLKLQLIEEA